jgi:predicted transcriptional regulator
LWPSFTRRVRVRHREYGVRRHRADLWNGYQLAGIVTRGSAKPIFAFADEPLTDVINRMLKNNIGRLPVVSRENPRQAVGYIGRSNIMAARLRRLEEEEVREGGGAFGKPIPVS